MSVSKFSKTKLTRIIALILINAFLLIDISWAGGEEFPFLQSNQMLSAPVQISQQQFNDAFNALCVDTTPDIQEKTRSFLSNSEPKNPRIWISRIVDGAPLIIIPVIIALSYGLSWAGDGIKETIEAVYFDYGLDVRGYGLPAFVNYIIMGLLGWGLFITFVYGVVYVIVPAYKILTRSLKNTVQWLNDQRYKILIKQKVDIGKFKLLKSHMNQARKMKIKYGDFSVYLNRGVLFISPPIVQEQEANKKAENDKTNKLQSHYLAGVGALIFAKIADAQNFIAHNSRVLAIVSIGGITLIASGFLINRLLKNKRLVRRFIYPIRERWYIWRLGLDRGNLIDMFIINRIYSTDNRRELLNSINSWMGNIQNKEKNLADLAQLESDEIFAKRLSEISAKLYSMGTDAVYFKAFYWVYSNIYRAPYYKHVLKLNPKINQNDNKFLQYVRRGKSVEWLIDNYLGLEITSLSVQSRGDAINLLNKLGNAGLFNKQNLVDMYLKAADSKFLDIAADAIIGLEDNLSELDQSTKIKLILKLQIIIENQEKEVKKARPRFSRIDDYFRKYEAKKAELLKFQALLIFMVLNLLSDFEKKSDMHEIVKIVAGLKRYVDFFGNDVNIQCSGYLEQILAVLNERKDKLTNKLKPESLPTMIANNILGKNNKAAKNEKIKVKLKQAVQQIKIVTGLLKQLEQKRNNYGMFSKMLLSIADIVVVAKNHKKEKIGLIEQIKIDLVEKASAGLSEQEKMNLIEAAI